MSSPKPATDHRDHSGPASVGPGWQRVVVVAIVAWLVICALVLAWGWLLTEPLETTIDPGEDDLARWFEDQRSPTGDDLAHGGTFLGETMVGAGIFAAIGLVVSLLKRTWRPLLLVVLGEAGIGAFYFAATELIVRDRPPVELLDAGLDPNASYPSGHTATAVVCWLGAVVLVWAYFRAARWWALVLLLLPVAALLARLYQGAHHLTDVLTSVVYASAWLLVLAGVLLPRRTSSG